MRNLHSSELNTIAGGHDHELPHQDEIYGFPIKKNEFHTAPQGCSCRHAAQGVIAMLESKKDEVTIEEALNILKAECAPH